MMQMMQIMMMQMMQKMMMQIMQMMLFHWKHKNKITRAYTFLSRATQSTTRYVGWLAQIILEETKASLVRDFCQISLHGVVTIVDDRVVPLQTS